MHVFNCFFNILNGAILKTAIYEACIVAVLFYITLIVALLADLLLVPALVKLGAIRFAPRPRKQILHGEVYSV